MKLIEPPESKVIVEAIGISPVGSPTIVGILHTGLFAGGGDGAAGLFQNIHTHTHTKLIDWTRKPYTRGRGPHSHPQSEQLTFIELLSQVLHSKIGYYKTFAISACNYWRQPTYRVVFIALVSTLSAGRCNQRSPLTLTPAEHAA